MLRRADFGLFHHCWCCRDIKQGIAWLWLQVLWCWPCLSLLGPLFVTFSGIDLCHWCDVIAEARPSFCWCGNATNKWLSLRGPLFFSIYFPRLIAVKFTSPVIVSQCHGRHLRLWAHCYCCRACHTSLPELELRHWNSCKKPPKKKQILSQVFKVYPCHKKKRIQTANVADSFFHLFPHFQLVRLHSAYWMIWQEWPPRWLLKDPPRVKGLKCDTCNSGLAVWVFHSGLERPVTWFFLSLCVSFGLVSFCSAPFHSFIHSSIHSFIHWWICDGFGVFPSLYTYMWAHISMSQN